MDRGKHIHKLCEEYIRGFHQEIPEEIKGLEDNFKELKELVRKRTRAFVGRLGLGRRMETNRLGLIIILWGRAKVDAFVWKKVFLNKARVI